MIDFDGLVLGACMDASIFGEPIIFQPQQGPVVNISTTGKPLTGIFEEKSTTTSIVDGDEITETKTMLNVQASQFAGNVPVQNDIIVIRGRYWRVVEPIPDGMGHIAIHVMLASDAQAALTPTPPQYS